jgi:hypothetical protein
MSMNLPDGFGNLIHVCPGAQKHRLEEPDGFLAEAIIFGTMIFLEVSVDAFA